VSDQPDSRRVYLPALDGLRFVAFLLVFHGHTEVVLHNDVSGALRAYGWLGVDLFLCLSAFLFTKLLFTEHSRTGGIKIFDFYVRRALRIWPLYFFFVGSMIVWTLVTVGLGRGLWLRSLGLLTFTDNLFAMRYNYSLVEATAHLWTISFEEQFYAVVPWLLGFLFVASRRRVLQLLGGLFLMGSGLRLVAILMNVQHPAIWTFPLTHLDSILAGLAVGLGLGDPLLRRVPGGVIGLAGVACLVGVMWLPNVSTIGYGLMLTYPLTGMGMGLIVLYVTHSDAHTTAKLLSWQPLTYLGKISYGLYVYHIAVRNVFAGRLDAGRGTLLWALDVYWIPLLMTVVVSVVSYEILEKPFLRMKARFTSVISRPV
jgi:peptidoglycan/LPS O-acetylase OafA/YrhL